MIKRRLLLALFAAISIPTFAADACEGALDVLSPFARLVGGAYDAGILPFPRIEITATSATPTNPLAGLAVTSGSAAYHTKFNELIVSQKIISQWPAIQTELLDLLSSKTRERRQVIDAREKTDLQVHPEVIAEVPGINPYVPITKDSQGNIWIAYPKGNRVYARNLSKSSSKVWAFPGLENNTAIIEQIGWLSSPKTEPVLRVVFKPSRGQPIEGLRSELRTTTAAPFTGPKWREGFMYPVLNSVQLDAWVYKGSDFVTYRTIELNRKGEAFGIGVLGPQSFLQTRGWPHAHVVWLGGHSNPRAKAQVGLSSEGRTSFRKPALPSRACLRPPMKPFCSPEVTTITKRSK